MTVLTIFNQVATVHEVTIGLGLEIPYYWDDGICDEIDYRGEKIITRPVPMGWDKYGNDVGVCRIFDNGYNSYFFSIRKTKDFL